MYGGWLQEPPGCTEPGTRRSRYERGSIHTTDVRTLVWTRSGRTCVTYMAGWPLIRAPVGCQTPSPGSPATIGATFVGWLNRGLVAGCFGRVTVVDGTARGDSRPGSGT